MRDSTIIYRSFYEAIIELPEKNQAEVWKAIFEYSLNFEEIELTGLSKTIFTLIKPQLEANIKRYQNGLKPKNKKSKTEAKPKQKTSETLTKEKGNHNPNENQHQNKNVDVDDNEKNRLLPLLDILKNILNDFDVVEYLKTELDLKNKDELILVLRGFNKWRESNNEFKKTEYDYKDHLIKWWKSIPISQRQKVFGKNHKSNDTGNTSGFDY